MAWIVKNSAQLTIERRPQPYLDEAMRAELERDVVPRYPQKRAAIMAVLHAIQHKHGHVPYQAFEEVAEFLDITAAEALDTASFYEEYAFEPRGRYVIWVCQSLSCELLGATGLLDALREHLGIEVGQTTEDGRFTLMSVECLGSCGTAPVALVNEQLHERITVENFRDVLSRLE